MRKTKGLYRRGNVYWICYKFKGKLYRESTGKVSQKEAEYVLACRRKENDEGELPKSKMIDYKFAELANAYSKWAERQKSYAASKRFMIKQIVGVFGNLNVSDLNTQMIEQWQSERLNLNKPATVNRVLACLKHMFTKAVDWDMASEETLKQVRKVKFLKEYNKRLRYLDVEGCQTLIDCCAPHLKPIVTVALNTGMRRGEILGLRWEQVDLSHGFILLEISKNGERREIPINTTLEYLFKEMPHSIESKYVFVDKDGKPYKDVKRSFGTAIRKAGISDFRFHDLRHTFASHLVMAGIDLISVKELLGHKTITMTLRYSHLAPEHKRKAVNTLDKVLRNDQKEIFSSQSGSHFEADSTCCLS
ncbi:MAG: site-specific integrase [Candidatus Scalindua sp.]|nr:site-specific integrase [Candidatus Scalindua sp.]MBT6052262.1 site-specific integrase [Candidatus Scalindua sp.]MBT6225221.1 site-specific integrase [Candidatus Scalindua sp.]